MRRNAPRLAGTRDQQERLLGEYDNVFLSHADRTRITGDGAWGTAYARFGTFFVDGFLAGAWRIAREGTRSTLRLDPRTSAAIGRAARADIESEAAALLEFLEPDRSRAVVWATG